MNSAIPADLAGAVLSIDLDALKANYRALALQAGNADCGAAVKGDAYGLGLGPVCNTLWQAGCRTFFVARPTEGADLRALLPDSIIYVLDGLHSGQAEYYAKLDLRPALISIDEAQEWAAFGRRYGRTLPCALHVDTGINRLGLAMAEYHALLADGFLSDGLNVALLMSHLACADDPPHALNQTQLQRFAEVRAVLPDVPASLSNSSGIYLDKAYAHNLVRPGIALYGGNPTAGKPNPMRAVAALHASIMQVRDVKAGETVGYSATWQAPRHSRIAILGAGYKDGIPRHLSSRSADGPAKVWIEGEMCAIVGRVSMDMVAVDVTDVPQAVKGTVAEIIGSHLAIDQVAGWAGTISYELLTRLGARYARLYSGLESQAQST